MNLKETCQMTDQEFEERTKTRAEEVKAVSEALAILSSDDAHDTFTSTFNFLQKSSKKSSSSREKAEKVLLKAAKKTGDPKIAQLATRVRLNGFKKVSDDIDGMVADLKKEIEELTKSIASLQAEVAEMQVQLKRAGEDRELE